MKKGFKKLIRHFYDGIRLLFLIMPKSSEYVKSFDDIKLMFFSIDDEQLLQGYELLGVGITRM